MAFERSWYMIKCFIVIVQRQTRVILSRCHHLPVPIRKVHIGIRKHIRNLRITHNVNYTPIFVVDWFRCLDQSLVNDIFRNFIKALNVIVNYVSLHHCKTSPQNRGRLNLAIYQSHLMTESYITEQDHCISEMKHTQLASNHCFSTCLICYCVSNFEQRKWKGKNNKWTYNMRFYFVFLYGRYSIFHTKLRWAE